MGESYIAYTITLMIACYFAQKAEKLDEKRYLNLSACLLSIIAGLRAYNVGLDTKSYVRIFEQISNGQLDTAWGETGFKIICFILLKIWSNPTFLFLFFSLVTNFLILFRLWDFRKYSSVVWMVACYYTSFYFFTFNAMRQFLSVAIVFYTTRYIAKRKYLIYLISVVIASFIHISSLIGIGFLAVEVLQWKFLSKRQKAFIGVMIFLCPIALVLINTDFSNYNSYFETQTYDIGFMIFAKLNYNRYFETQTYDIGFMIFAKLVLLGVSALGFSEYKNDEEDERTAISEYIIRSIKIYYFIGLCLTTLGYVYRFMNRIGYVYYLFECIYYGMIVEKSVDKRIYKVVFSLLLIYIFVNSLIHDGQGVMPYKFIWQV